MLYVLLCDDNMGIGFVMVYCVFVGFVVLGDVDLL